MMDAVTATQQTLNNDALYIGQIQRERETLLAEK